MPSLEQRVIRGISGIATATSVLASGQWTSWMSCAEDSKRMRRTEVDSVQIRRGPMSRLSKTLATIAIATLVWVRPGHCG